MTFYRNDKGFLSQVPAAAGDADAVQWQEVDKQWVVSEFNKTKSDLESAARQITELSDRALARQRQLNSIEEYVSEAAKEGNEELNIKEFAEEFGFSLEVQREFTMTIEIQGTATFPIGEDPDLSDADVVVEVSSYYSSDLSYEVDGTSVYTYDWQ